MLADHIVFIANASYSTHLGFFSSFKIVSDAYDGYSKVELVGKLPKGTVIIIESIKREEGKIFLGYFPFREEDARVRLDDPKHPKSRISASISLKYIEQNCSEKK